MLVKSLRRKGAFLGDAYTMNIYTHILIITGITIISHYFANSLNSMPMRVRVEAATILQALYVVL